MVRFPQFHCEGLSGRREVVVVVGPTTRHDIVCFEVHRENRDRAYEAEIGAILLLAAALSVKRKFEMEDLKDSNKGKKNDVAENGSFAEIGGRSRRSRCTRGYGIFKDLSILLHVSGGQGYILNILRRNVFVLNPRHVDVQEAAPSERGSIGAATALAGLGLEMALGAEIESFARCH
ncbi:hypothetical protein NL676_027506 [Syzygium grande]|nr:hypothetical protein NL676_027506 [Syzygium grande]